MTKTKCAEKLHRMSDAQVASLYQVVDSLVEMHQFYVEGAIDQVAAPGMISLEAGIAVCEAQAERQMDESRKAAILSTRDYLAQHFEEITALVKGRPFYRRDIDDSLPTPRAIESSTCASRETATPIVPQLETLMVEYVLKLEVSSPHGYGLSLSHQEVQQTIAAGMGAKIMFEDSPDFERYHQSIRDKIQRELAEDPHWRPEIGGPLWRQVGTRDTRYIATPRNPSDRRFAYLWGKEVITLPVGRYFEAKARLLIEEKAKRVSGCEDRLTQCAAEVLSVKETKN